MTTRLPPVSVALLVALLFGGVARAQDEPLPLSPSPLFEARAGIAQHVLVREAVTFDAGESIVPPDASTEFKWFFGDGKQAVGAHVTHTYTRPGAYTVQLRLRAGNEAREDSTSVRVYRTQHLFLTDGSAPADVVTSLQQIAAEDDVLLSTMDAVPGAATPAEGIARQTLDHRAELTRASLIVIWASGTTGADALQSLGQLTATGSRHEQEALGMDTKGVILVTDQSFAIIARPAQTAFNVLRPQYVLLARPDALPDLIRARTADEAQRDVLETQHAYTILGTHSERAVSRLTPWNALSYVVNALVNAGVPTSSIVLILMLPVVATLLAFSRQVIGIKAFGIFTPAAVTLSFLALGLTYGLIVFTAVLLAATLSRVLLRRFRLLYLPRMAIVLTAVSLAVLGLFAVGAVFRQTGTLAFSVFPILLLASLAEQFVEAQIRLGFRTAAQLTVETLLLSVASTLIVQWQTLRSFVVGFPEVILLTIPLNILLGRWTGLRLTEYVRFRRLLFPSP